jgi:hypothetical protein
MREVTMLNARWPGVLTKIPKLHHPRLFLALLGILTMAALSVTVLAFGPPDGKGKPVVVLARRWSLGSRGIAGGALCTMLIGLGCSSGGQADLPNTSEGGQSSLATPGATSSTVVGVIGPVVRVAQPVIIVRDGEGDHEVILSETTIIEGATNGRVIRDNNIDRVHLGDAVTVSGSRGASAGTIFATVISVNFFASRPAIVVSVNNMTVVAKMPLDNGSAPVLVELVVDPAVAVDAYTRRPVSASALSPGQQIAVQAFRDEHGVFVVLSVG